MHDTSNGAAYFSRKGVQQPSVPRADDEPRRRDVVTAASRADAPFLVGLSGADPDRVDLMRVGYWPGWAT